jgi:SAM-dependent methyltransferase
MDFDLNQHLTRQNPGSVVFTSTYLTPLPLDRTSVLADVGSGLGERAAWVARSRFCQIHAFDQDESNLEYTHQRTEESGSGHLISLHQPNDYRQLAVESQSLDLLIAEGVAFDLDPIATLPYWRNYVKPGKHIAIVIPGVVNRHPPQELVATLEKRMGRRLGTLEEYHAEINDSELRLVHQVQFQNYGWVDHYISLHQLIRGLVKTHPELETHPQIEQARQELDWFRNYGQGRLFLQAFVLMVP